MIDKPKRKSPPLFSEEHRHNISLAKKGLKLSNDTKTKISISLTGRKLTEYHKIAVSKGSTGKKLSEYTKQKISNSTKGVSKQPFSDEHRLKIAKSNTGKSRTVSEETKRKISAKLMGHSVSQSTIKKILGHNRFIINTFESKFLRFICKNNLPFCFVGNGSFVVGNKNPDFIHTGGKFVAIDIYNSYFKNKRYKNIDVWINNRKEYFKSYGWDLILLDENQVKNCLSIIKEIA